MAKINAINNKTGSLTIDPGASGDSYTQYSINGTGEFRVGVDDDASDAYKISQGSALGTNDTFVMTADGERTMPLQPAFLEYIASDDNNVTGSVAYTVGTNTAYTEIYDQNGDFSGTTFTAPITGRYFLCASMKIGGIVAATTGRFVITTSNRWYWSEHLNPLVVKDSSNIISLSLQVVVDMDVSDTAYVTLNFTGEASDINDLLGQATNPISWFCGYLVV
jgi:hypothetical protein